MSYISLEGVFWPVSASLTSSQGCNPYFLGLQLTILMMHMHSVSYVYHVKNCGIGCHTDL